MQLTIDSMKKDLTAFRSGEKWYNQDRKALPDFTQLKAGNKVEVADAEAESGWIKSIKVVDATVKTFGAPKSFGGGFKKAENTPEKDAMIARHTAVKAVYESPYFVEMVKDLDHAEAKGMAQAEIVELTQYITTGKF